MRNTKSGLQSSSPMKAIKRLNMHNDRYFCHYSNYLYMGGFQNFMKNGNGIILMDNGSCIISSYLRNNMAGHNLIFHEDSLTSLIVDNHHNKDICFRFQSFILHFNYTSEKIINGKGHLIDFNQQKVYQLKFVQSHIRKKTRYLQQNDLVQIFEQKKFELLLDQRHADAMRMNFTIPNGCDVTKQNDFYMIGYRNKNTGKFNGLGFKIKIIQTFQNIHIELSDRGYYQNSLLNDFGQKHFQNLNFYTGLFKEGNFHGKGILVDHQQNNWALGSYKEGRLIKILNSSIEYATKKQQRQAFSKILNQLHRQNCTYIENKMVLLPPQSLMIRLLQNIKSYDIHENQAWKNQADKQRKIKNLVSIQQDFIHGKYLHKTEQAIKSQLSPQKNTQVQINDQYDNKKINKMPIEYYSPSKTYQRLNNNSPWRHSKLQTDIIGKYRNALNQSGTHSRSYLRSGETFQSPQRYSQNYYYDAKTKWRENGIAYRNRNDSKSQSRGKRKHINYLQQFEEEDDLNYRLKKSPYSFSPYKRTDNY